MAVPTAKFTLTAATKLADLYYRDENAAKDQTGNRSHRKSYNDRGFWGKITCYCPLTSGQWKYSFTEMIRTKEGWTSKENGRTGDCCGANYAINSVEAYNGEEDYYGNSQPYEDSGSYLLPVRGEPIVWIRMDFPQTSGSATGSADDLESNGLAGSAAAKAVKIKKPVYSFAYENGEGDSPPASSTCGCDDENSSGSESSNAFNCVYAFTVQYDCDAGEWGSVQRSGVNCQVPPATTGSWISGGGSKNFPIYYYFAVGASCPGPEKTSGCTEWPATPAPPTFTPPCGSSSDTYSSSSISSSTSAFHCVYAFSSQYNCTSMEWSPAERSGVNCQVPPATVNQWVGSHLTAYYYVVGAECPGPEQTAGCTAWPDAPDVAPDWTPSCGSSSSSAMSSTSSSSGECPGLYSGSLTVVTGFNSDDCTVTTVNMRFKCGKLVEVS